MFDDNLLFLISKNSRRDEDWYAIWTTILNTLFPIKDGYCIEPIIRQGLPTGKCEGVRYIILQVIKIRKKPYAPQPVLVVKAEVEEMWELAGPKQILKEMSVDLQESFDVEPMYWIASVGSRWRYGTGKKTPKGGFLQEVDPLITWQKSLTSKTSRDHLAELVRLVYSKEEIMDEPGPPISSPPDSIGVEELLISKKRKVH